MGEDQTAPSLREFVHQHYSAIVQNIDPGDIAEWVINLKRIRETYPTLWNTPLSEFDELSGPYPEEAEKMLRLLPLLAINVADYGHGRSEEEIEAEGAEITIAMLQVLLQLFHITYIAGYTDGQQKLKKTVLS